jgi:hypothetical protein
VLCECCDDFYLNDEEQHQHVLQDKDESMPSWHCADCGEGGADDLDELVKDFCCCPGDEQNEAVLAVQSGRIEELVDELTTPQLSLVAKALKTDYADAYWK